MSSTPSSRATSTPLRTRVNRANSSSAATPVRRAPIATGTPKQTPVSKGTGSKKVLSPTRDPHGNSPRLETKENVAAKAKKTHPLANVSVPLKHGNLSTRGSVATGRTNSSTNKRRTSPAAVDTPVAIGPENTVAEGLSSISNARSRSRAKTTPSISEPDSGSVPVASRSVRTVSSSSIASATTCRKQSSSTPPVPPIPSISTDFAAKLCPVSPIPKSGDGSRTPSPDLPGMKMDLVTPIPAHRKKKAMAVLGLGTPEVHAWIKAGVPKNRVLQNSSTQDKTRVKSVGFRDGADDMEDNHAEGNNNLDFNEVQEREKSLSLQISPRRPTSSESQSQSHGSSHSWDASPMMRSRQAAHIPGTPSAGSAHELLRTIVKDVMYDFQRETKAEMIGLHLDLVRMGRGWKQELRTLMDEYVGDLNDLREENRKLREENDRLRRF